MRVDLWLREFYPRIISDFGFSRSDDERAAELIHRLGKGKLMSSTVLADKITGRDVVIVGGAVEEEDLDSFDSDVVITAGKSILKVREFDPSFIPDVHVTDLEEPDDLLVEIGKRCILVLHAHGDNVHRIRSVVPKLEGFIATTQSKPFDRVYNFGGFTDGDRAAIIAKTFGARSIRLVGFDFDKAEGIKLKKLRWAKRILMFEGIL